MVAADEPARPRDGAGGRAGAAGDGRGRGGAPLQAAALGRAELHAREIRPRLARLPGAQRPRAASPLGAGVLRVPLLLVGEWGGGVGGPACGRIAAGARTRRRTGAGGKCPPPPPPPPPLPSDRESAGRWRCAGCGPGWRRGSCWRAIGAAGRPSRHPHRCTPCSIGWGRVAPSCALTVPSRSQQTTAKWSIP